METIELLIDLHKDSERQGPGSNEMTNKALEFVNVTNTNALKILDIGCGTGAQTIVLAEQLNGSITAVDQAPEFLEQLQTRANEKGMSNRITTLPGSMDKLPVPDAGFDIIWSEGAIYNMGFEKGLNYWKQFLKPNGYLAVTEISRLTRHQPSELTTYWKNEYPAMDGISGNIQTIEKCGLLPVAHFVLPNECWTDNYYHPLQKKFPEFLVKHGSNPAALKVIEHEMQEIDIFNKYNQYFGYVFYIARLSGE
ncbi:MAG: methyltransferase domain-containing protein [Bacteroidetes bacterium]|jgi:ubiquinone/menaquinone biosynthesis C-methylase UbiE|nr:methyltransferase domain-containing protein [Bacteroidota bacterium]